MKTTRFRLNLPGFTIELAGQQDFVEDLYSKISRDVTAMMNSLHEPTSPPKPAPQSPLISQANPAIRRRAGFTWIYYCTHLFNKVYVVENTTIETTPLGRYIDLDRLRRVYVNSKPGTTFLGDLPSDNKTLWAEFTDEGRALLKKSLKDRNDALEKG